MSATIDDFRNEFGHVILNLIINARDAIATRRAAAPDEAPGNQTLERLITRSSAEPRNIRAFGLSLFVG